jgi:HlyD family secretion protein
MKYTITMRHNPIARATAVACAVGLLLPGVVTLAGCGKKTAGGGKGKNAGPTITPVTVTNVKLGTVEQTVPVTGNLEALQDVSLAARVTARVVAVNAREGDQVRAGQVLVQQDTTDLEETVRQAQANVQNLDAQLAQAKTNYQIEVNQAKQAVLKDQAGVAAAQYNYSKVKQGNRKQQVLQSQASVQQAKANLDNADITLKRNQALFQQGAIARADLDTAQTTYTVDLQLYKNAQASLSLTKAGNYPQDIAYAAEQTKEAVATLQNDVANLQTIAVRKQQIAAAQAAVTQAQATVAYDQRQVSYATITSPIDGRVATRATEPGQIASTSASVMRVVNVRTMYYEPTISETDLAQTSVGDTVQVNVDALPGKNYSGKVVAIYPAASTTNRVFTLRVDIDDPNYELRPGMFARGGLVTEVHRNVVVVPVAALVPLQSSLDAEANQGSDGVATGGTTLPSQQVFLVGPDNKAVAQTVNLGIVTATTAEVTSGLKAGDPLITTGQDQVQTGQVVNVVGTGGHHHGGKQSSVASLPGS